MKSTKELAAWERDRNAAGAVVRWRFTVEKAREKMPGAYPELSVKITETGD